LAGRNGTFDLDASAAAVLSLLEAARNRNPAEMKPRVIYIAGYRILRSTFLDMLLGSLPAHPRPRRDDVLPALRPERCACMCGHHLRGVQDVGVLSDFPRSARARGAFRDTIPSRCFSNNARNEPEYFRSDEVRRYAASQAGIIDAICRPARESILSLTRRRTCRDCELLRRVAQDRVELVAVHLLANPFDQALVREEELPERFNVRPKGARVCAPEFQDRRYLRRGRFALYALL
jgi:hypothetical protein